MGASIIPGAGIGLTVASQILKGKGESEGLKYKAAQSEEASRAGRVAAAQTDAQLRDQLHTTLSHIGAIRASAGVDPNSPTTRAVLDEETRVGDRERNIRVGNLISQADADQQAAGFYRRSARAALPLAVIGAAGTGFSQAAYYGSR